MNCEHFGICGSCKLYDLSYDEQLEEKLSAVQDAFRHIYTGSFDVAKSMDSHYRARSEFKLWHEGDEMFYAMNTLEKKGLLKRRKRGLVNFYRPTRSRNEMTRVEVSTILSRVFQGSVAALADSLLSIDDLSLDEIDQIKRLVRRKERELKEGE